MHKWALPTKESDTLLLEIFLYQQIWDIVLSQVLLAVSLLDPRLQTPCVTFCSVYIISCLWSCINKLEDKCTVDVSDNYLEVNVGLNLNTPVLPRCTYSCWFATRGEEFSHLSFHHIVRHQFHSCGSIHWIMWLLFATDGDDCRTECMFKILYLTLHCMVWFVSLVEK